MPVIIPASLPAAATLAAEHIAIISPENARRQELRPLQIAILNLMPTKEATETQFLRLIGSTPIQVEPLFLTTRSYTAKNTPVSHLETFYSHFDEVRERHFDALIITGAPVEQLSFEEVLYWRELRDILDWAAARVFASLFVCWGAQAALYHYYGVPKLPLEKKMFGVFPHTVSDPNHPLLAGFDDTYYAPHSRHTTVLAEHVAAHPDLQVLGESPSAGLFMAASRDHRRVFITGHIEYDRHTLADEYRRDLAKGLPIDPPVNYFPGDNPTLPPRQQWKAHSYLLYQNWIDFICRHVSLTA
ncbi:MAG: homoserine O-succinyltransferase [Verrucomicrobiales bacterium]|jgi:homoserine O-succinyltransferase|nr:homoserine O-succinyltransferase [Verrucomicrobiales bacterium]